METDICGPGWSLYISSWSLSDALSKSLTQGSHGDWKTWKMKNGHGKIMEYDKLVKKHGI